MRKKRLRGGQREQQTTGVPERTARVRNRLIVSVVIISLTVLGAGALGLADAMRDMGDSERLIPLARTAADAVALAHSLADERDAMTEYVGGGRGPVPAALTARRAQVDRKLREFTASRAARTALPGAVRSRLDGLAEARRRALAGPGEPLAVFSAYTTTVQALHGVADTLAVRLPPRAGAADAAAVALLGRAVEEASATRGLHLGALAAHGTRFEPELAGAAQQTAFREQAALADFAQLAPAKARDAYAATVTGPEVIAAEAELARITSRPQPGQEPAAEPVGKALTARLELMRGVESALAAAESAHLVRVRDRDVSALEARGALAGLCFLIALLAGVQSARSMTRPLAALRLGARRVCADPLAREPVSVKGRDDEFAEVARSVNVLHGTVVRQRERITLLEGERNRLDGARADLAEERDALRVRDQELTAQLAGLTTQAHATCASLSLRTLGLVERQLTVIEAMEAHEADPDRLEVLFKLDHLATRMRRHSENLLVLAGAEAGAGHPGPVPLLDVLRAAISEIDRYERVRIHSLPARAQLAGFAADDVSHLVAELLENATVFSPPDVQVQVSGWLLENGDVMLSVQDEGIGMAPDRLAELNSLLAQEDPQPRGVLPGGGEPGDDAVMGLGLYVVARLAARHGVRVQLREQRPGGITAVVVLPARLLPAAPPAAADPSVPDPQAPPPGRFPGAVAEANSHMVQGRPRRTSSVGPRPAPPGPPPDDPTIELTAVPEERPPVGRHARPPAPAPAPTPAPAPASVPRQPHPGQVNGTGLPKRTPRPLAQKPPERSVRKGVDAEALRRKLAGFQQGARDGRRDVEAELTGRDIDQRRAGALDEGGNVEEARG